MSYGTKTVSDTASKIVSAETNRHSLILVNVGTETVYIGPDSSVTAANGIPLLQDASYEADSGGVKLYMGDIWAITSSGTADLRYWERIEFR